MDQDISASLQEQVRHAYAQGIPLNIIGGNSKSFYGRAAMGQSLLVSAHQGIVNYQPSELVISARAGTPLHIIESTLAEQGQMLAFEPPHFGSTATLGGTIACGLSGPRRPFSGSVRDFMLGVRLINGQGEIVKFGGEVMKNVAGYDVSRLMTGALGTLGIILEPSLKVLPKPAHTVTLAFDMSDSQALGSMNELAQKPLPLSAMCYDGSRLFLRLEGTSSGVLAAQKKLGGEEHKNAETFWLDVREHAIPFFSLNQPLWRLSVPPATGLLALPGQWFIDWGGAQRWLMTDAPASMIREVASKQGGHATLFRHGDRQGDIFQSLSPPLALLHQKLKKAFDERGIFNVGRMYPQW